MMAKMFYTMDETKVALGKNEEEVKQLARDGRLREFRDGPRLMFKADQVEALKKEMGADGGDQVDLGAGDTMANIGLVDSKSATGSAISLADTDFGREGESGAPVKEDTALAQDLGMTGSLGGMPSPSSLGTGSRSGTLSGSMSGTRSGITVFGAEDTLDRADPKAQTTLSSSMQDQINLEGIGSGSGLLDLTRESDDTSLGAELIDEITPGGSGAASKSGAPAAAGSGVPAGVAPSDSAVGMAALGEMDSGPARVGVGAPVYAEMADPMAPAFGWLAGYGALVVLFGLFIVSNATVGVRPAFLKSLQDMGLTAVLIGLAGAIISFGIGWATGRGGNK